MIAVVYGIVTVALWVVAAAAIRAARLQDLAASPIEPTIEALPAEVEESTPAEAGRWRLEMFLQADRQALPDLIDSQNTPPTRPRS